MADESLITLGVAEFENLMETQGLDNTVDGVLAIANDELDPEAIGGVPLTRESLANGTHPILDKLDRYRYLKPEDRNVQPEEILTLFTNVEDFGKYDPEKGTYSGLKAGTYSAARAAPEAIGGGYGAAKGFQAGMYLQSFIPPAGPPGLILKGLAVAVPTIGGAIIGALAGGAAEDAIIGEAAPVVPSLQPATNAGETAVMAASLLASPWTAAPKQTTGALEFLGNFSNVASGKFAKTADDAFELTAKNAGLSQKMFERANAARIAAQQGPMFGGAKGADIGLGRFNPAGYLVNPAKGPVSSRILGAVETGVGKSMEAARNRPGAFLSLEGLSAAGGATGAYLAQQNNPYDEGSRFLYEVVGSFAVPIPVQVGAAVAPSLKPSNIVQTVKNWWGKPENTEGLLTRGMKKDAIKRIEAAIKLSADNVDLQAADGKTLTPDEQFALFFEKMQELSVDADGNPTVLTFQDVARQADDAVGTKFSPTISTIQSELEKSSKDLALATGRGREEAQAGAVNMIRTLAATGDPQALAMAARIQQGLFEQNIIDNMESSVARLMEAGKTVLGREAVDAEGKRVPSQRGELSVKLYDVLKQQIDMSKFREKKLWGEVKSYPLTEFFARNGKEIDQPNVLQLLDRPSTRGGLKFMAKGRRASLNSALGGYKEDFDELRAYFQNGQGRNPANAKRFFEMRSGLLEKAAELRRSGNISIAGDLDQINEALLRDLTGQKTNSSEAYNNARAYTFARNNVFRRSFLNDVQLYNKQRGAALDPASLIDAMFKGGNLATTRRIEQIEAAGQFLVDEAGYSPDVIGKMDSNGIVQAALRDSLSKVMTEKTTIDPVTGEKIRQLVVNPTALSNFRKEPGTKELFKLVDGLEEDLSSVEAAQNAYDNTLGNIADKINPSAARKRGLDDEQLNALYDTKAFQSVLEFENPAKAVSKALTSEKPTMALNALYRMVDEADYRDSDFTREQALSGLKSAIFARALNKANRTGTLPNGEVLQKELFGQLEGVDPSIKFTMEDFLIRKGLVDETKGKDGLTEMERVGKAIKTMRGIEEAYATGDFENVLFKKPSLAKLFYVRIFGATAGSAVQNKLKNALGLPQMGGGLIAEQTGSELVQRLLLRGPESQRTKIMTEMFSNPNLLASMMNEKLGKEAQDNAMSYASKILSPMSKQVGRRVPYGITAGEKEISEEYVPPRPEEVRPLPPSNQQGSLNTVPVVPPTQTGPVTQPSPVQQAAAPPQVAPVQSSGPVDRTRYAALFPNDSATQLMKSGIGSLGA